MRQLILFFVFASLCLTEVAAKCVFPDNPTTNPDNAIYISSSSDSDSVFVHQMSPYETIPTDSVVRKSSRENVRLVAAVLAFPFPFGMIGLHRIYLGTKPWVPFIYLVTLGGCFGVLPFIDFVVILLQDEESLQQYRNNGKIFMWVN
jgi:TM2 domain-containing membrane protein YozV